MQDVMAMLDKRPLLHLLRAHPVEFAYVFGSVASGAASLRSDLDIAVYVSPSLSPRTRMRLRLRLLREISSLPPPAAPAAGGVDLVLLNDCPLNLAFGVVHGGKLILCRDQRRRIAFEAGTRSRYFDRLYYLNRGSRRVLERAASRGMLGQW